MSILRGGGTLSVACDGCYVQEDLEAGDFAGARRELVDLGWMLTFNEGEWEDLCPACAEGVEEKNLALPWEKEKK